MAKKKVYISVTTRLIVEADENVDIDDFISNMHYDFTSNTEGVEVIDTVITDSVIKENFFIS